MDVEKGYTPRLLRTNALENKDEFDERSTESAVYLKLMEGNSSFEYVRHLTVQCISLIRRRNINNREKNLDSKCDKAYKHVQGLIQSLSDKEAHDVLNKAIANNSHEQVTLGLLVSILIEPMNASKSYRDLTLLNRDGFKVLLGHFNIIVQDFYLRLVDIVRSQAIWLFREMLRAGVAGVDGVCFTLLRQCAGGDLSHRNLAHIEAMLATFENNRAWLDKHPEQLRAVVVTFLRLMEDHTHPGLTVLRNREAAFTVSIIRDRFAQCMAIGRDFVRLLQNVARIPEIEKLWKDILHNPRSLCPNFTGIQDLMLKKTEKKMLICRLTPDMETKIWYLTNNVRFGNHKRYQDWFHSQYLSTQEAQSLRCDLIRFIVCVIHPSNHVLGSDIMPRWAVIGWLLTTCTSTTISCNGKLALLYDWLFFDSEKDNIMNIEPGILVMHNSLRPHPVITATLLDFLCRIVPGFYPPLTEKVQQGITSSLRLILEKRVLPSLYHLFDNPKLDVELRNMLKYSFKEFCFAPPPVKDDMDRREDENCPEHDGTHPGTNNNHHESEPAFSDDEEEVKEDEEEEEYEEERPAGTSLVQVLRRLSQEDDDDDDIPLAKVKLKKGKRTNKNSHQTLIFEGEVRSAVEVLRSEADNEQKCQAMERLTQSLTDGGEELEKEICTALSMCLCVALKDQLEPTPFNEEPTQEMVDTRTKKPLFILVRHLYQMCLKEDKRRQPPFTLLADMQHRNPQIGYHLLFYLKTCKPSDKKSALYKEYASALKRDEESVLLSDLKLCQEDDVHLFCWLIPEVYTLLPTLAVGHADLMRIVVGAIDAKQLQDLVCLVLQGELTMLNPEAFSDLLVSSLKWETMEQYWLWQLAFAHDVPLEAVLPALPQLDFVAHSEATSCVLLMLKEERPTVELMKLVMSREVRTSKDVLVVSLLKHWCRNHEEKVGELVAGLLSSRQPNTSPNKRKRGGNRATSGAAASGVNPERVLAHLDQLRINSGNSYPLYALDSVQRALQQVQGNCTEAQKKMFSELFALAGEEVEVDTRKSKKGSNSLALSTSRGKTNTRGSRPPYKEPNTSEDSSEGEEIVKKQSKKRKKLNAVGSDSD